MSNILLRVAATVGLCAFLLYGAYWGGKWYGMWAIGTYGGFGPTPTYYRQLVETGIIAALLGFTTVNTISFVSTKIAVVIAIPIFIAGFVGAASIEPYLDSPKWLKEYVPTLEVAWNKAPSSVPWFEALEHTVQERWGSEVLSGDNIQALKISPGSRFPKAAYSFKPKVDTFYALGEGLYISEEICVKFWFRTYIPINEQNKEQISFGDFSVRKC